MPRRVNTRFLIPLTLGIMGLVLAGLLLQFWLRPGNRQEHLATAERYLAAGDYRRALEAYGRAQRIRQEADVLVKMGDCIAALMRTEPEQYTVKLLPTWERALELDPRHTLALQRIVDARIDLAELQPADLTNWEALGVKAARLAETDSSHVRAAAWAHAAALAPWLRAGRAATSQASVHLAALQTLLERQTPEPIVLQTVADARLRLARDYQAAGNPEAAAAERQKLLQAVATLQATDNPSMLLACARALLTLAAEPDQGDQAAADRPPAAGEGRSPPGPTHVAQAGALLARAAQVVPENHPDYVEINLLYSRWLRAEGRGPQATSLLQALTEARPDDMRIRLALTEVLRATLEGRRQAAELLARPTVPDPAARGFKALLTRYYELERLYNLALIQIDLLPTVEAAERPALRQLVTDTIATLARATLDSPSMEARVHKLRGYLGLLDAAPDPGAGAGTQAGQARTAWLAAINHLETARKLTEQLRAFDAELMYRLALAYLTPPDRRDRQPGQSATLLRQTLERRPADTAARRLLVQALLAESNFTAAAQQIALLEPALKDDPGLLRDKIIVMSRLGQTDQVRPMVESLPEATRADRLRKAAAAETARLTSLADRLLRGLAEEEIGGAGRAEGRVDYAGTQMLARALLTQRKREEAMAVVLRALEKDPNSPQLRYLRLVLEGRGNPADLDSLYADLAGEGAAAPAAAVRAIQKQQWYLLQGQTEEAYQALVAAAAENPDDPPILEALFSQALTLKKIDEAARVAANLERLNADQTGGLSYRTRLKLARGDLDGALRDATELTGRLGSLAGSWVIRGQVEQALAERRRLGYEVPAASFRKALESQADSYEALRGLVECSLGLGQYQIAREYIRRGMQTAQGAVFAEMDRRLTEQTGDPTAVTAAREQAARENPDSLPARQALAENYLRVSEFLSGKGEKAQAEAFLNRAGDAYAQIVQRWPDDLTAATRLAQVRRRQDRATDAVEVVRALADRPAWQDRPEALLALAEIQLVAGKTLEASRVWDQILARFGQQRSVRQLAIDYYFRTRQHDKGIAVLTDLVTETGDFALRMKLVEILLSAGRPAEAEAACRQLLDRSAEDPGGLALLARVRLATGKVDEAGALLERVLRTTPRDVLALYYRGQVKLVRGDVAGAVVDLTAARNLQSPDPAAVPSLADIRDDLFDALRRRGQIDDAANELEAALLDAPGRTDLRQKLATVYFLTQRWNDLQRVLDDTKRRPELAGDALWYKTEAQMWLARAGSGDLDRALAAILVASQLAPQDAEVNYTFLDIQLRRKQYDTVIDVTDKVLASELPRPWWMWMCRGAALAAKSRQAEALRAFEAAMAAVDDIQSPDAAERVSVVMGQNLGLAPTAELLGARLRPYWALCIVRLHAEAADWPAAFADVARIQDQLLDNMSPTLRTRTLGYIGQVCTAAAFTGVPGAAERAVAAYSKLLERAEADKVPVLDRLNALNNLASVLLEGPQADTSRALALAQQAYDLMRQLDYIEPAFADTYAWSLVVNGRLDEGLKILQGLGAREVSIPDIYYHLGEAYLRKGRPEDARASLDRAAGLLEQSRQKGRFVDPALEGRIKQAAQRARESGG
jgi:predicted Zn-dependent protease